MIHEQQNLNRNFKPFVICSVKVIIFLV